MLSHLFLLLPIVLSHLVAGHSFYDNPEQDPIPENGIPLDELKEKWSIDVRITLACCHNTRTD